MAIPQQLLPQRPAQPVMAEEPINDTIRYEEEDLIPAEEVGFPPRTNSEEVTQQRWEARQLLHNLWRNLAARSYVEREDANGELRAYLKKSTHGRSLVNDTGAMHIINLIQSDINQVVALSNISERMANNLWRTKMNTIAALLVKKEKEWDCEDEGTKAEIMADMKNLVYMQYMRAVGGHEAEMAVTGIQRGTQVVHEHAHKSGWRPFSRNEEDARA